MTADELAERRRWGANRNLFGVQMFDPPAPHPYQATKPPHDDGEPPASD